MSSQNSNVCTQTCSRLCAGMPLFHGFKAPFKVPYDLHPLCVASLRRLAEYIVKACLKFRKAFSKGLFRVYLVKAPYGIYACMQSRACLAALVL